MEDSRDLLLKNCSLSPLQHPPLTGQWERNCLGQRLQFMWEVEPKKDPKWWSVWEAAGQSLCCSCREGPHQDGISLLEGSFFWDPGPAEMASGPYGTLDPGSPWHHNWVSPLTWRSGQSQVILLGLCQISHLEYQEHKDLSPKPPNACIF